MNFSVVQYLERYKFPIKPIKLKRDFIINYFFK